jgi:ecdysteroid 25-hydroxylase CYP306A1
LANFIPYFGFLPLINPKQPQKTFFELSKKFGKIFSLQIGSVFTVVISDANLIRETFKKEEFGGRAPLHITTGIFGGYGEKIFETFL